MRKILICLCLCSCEGAPFTGETTSGKIALLSSKKEVFQLPLPMRPGQTGETQQREWRTVEATPAIVRAIKNDPRSRGGAPEGPGSGNELGFCFVVKLGSKDPVTGAEFAFFLFDEVGHIFEVDFIKP